MKLATLAGTSLAAVNRRLSGVRLPSPGDNTVLDRTNSFDPAATATASLLAHTKGAWQEIVTATTVDAFGLVIRPTTVTSSGVDTALLLDIGIGGSGSEVVVVPNISLGHLSTGYPIYLPVFIPANTRIAICCQSIVVLKTVGIALRLIPASPGERQPARTMLDLNANTATSRGTTPTAPGSLNTPGAWTTLVASTPQPLRGLLVCCGGSANTAQGTANHLVDIAVGAAGSEVIIVPGVSVSTTVTERLDQSHRGVFPTEIIPAGTRLSGRYQRSATGASIDVVLLGVPA